MTKLLVLLTLFVLVHSPASIHARALGRSALTNADKAAIIQLSIELIIEQKARLKRQGIVHPAGLSEFMIIAGDNMSPALLPKIRGFRFSLMREKEIQRKGRRSERFKYLRVGEFSGEEDNVTFSLGIIERRGGLPYHSEVCKYLFSKSGDKWQGKILTIIC